MKPLGDRGIFAGYGDGTFRGDQTMTRYEMAALTDRALKNGAETGAPWHGSFRNSTENWHSSAWTPWREQNGHSVIERVRVNRGWET